MSKERPPAVQAERIRILNDTFRQSSSGGRIMITRACKRWDQRPCPVRWRPLPLSTLLMRAMIPS